MSIALDRNGTSHHRRFVRKMACTPVYNSEEYGGDRRQAEDRMSSSSTSSIGRNSDESSSLGGGGSGGGGGDGEEVQSKYKGGPLDSLEALEEVLPIKRGISNFYSGKSKSFTSLAHATSCTTIKEIAKPENAYSRKRKNLLASNIIWNKNHDIGLRSNSRGLSKRPTNSRSSLGLAAMGFSESNSNSESSNSNSSSPVLTLPPLPPHARKSSNKESSASPQSQKFTPWRSFSLSDLQGAAAAASPSITGLFDDNEAKLDKFH